MSSRMFVGNCPAFPQINLILDSRKSGSNITLRVKNNSPKFSKKNPRNGWALLISIKPIAQQYNIRSKNLPYL